MRIALSAAVVLWAAPAFALTVDEERAAIEAACNGLELGEAQCSCIAADAVAGELDARMREIVLLSLTDDVGFTIRAQGGEFANEDIDRLIAYQEYVQSKCATGATGG